MHYYHLYESINKAQEPNRQIVVAALKFLMLFLAYKEGVVFGTYAASVLPHMWHLK